MQKPVPLVILSIIQSYQIPNNMTKLRKKKRNIVRFIFNRIHNLRIKIHFKKSHKKLIWR